MMEESQIVYTNLIYEFLENQHKTEEINMKHRQTNMSCIDGLLFVYIYYRIFRAQEDEHINYNSTSAFDSP